MILIILGLWLLPVMSVFSPARAATSDIAQQRQELEQRLQEIQQQISQYQKELVGIKGEKNTLTNKIRQLQSQQATLRLQIEETNLQLSFIDAQVLTVQSAIAELNAKKEKLQNQLGESIRQLNRLDQRSLIYVVLMSRSLSEIFDQIQGYEQLVSGIGTIFKEIRVSNEQLKQQEEILNHQREESQNLLGVKTLQQNLLVSSVNEQGALLSKTKGRESEYQNMLSTSQQEASAIRNQIYQLFNVGKQITFGQAVEIASWVADQTGVPTAFLLAILTQESNLGQNVGTCNRSGDPAWKSWKAIMKPERDQQPFLQITSELGLDPDVTPVSCPMFDKSGNQIGWGGAMGPAQFIPSTWMGYKDKVSALTGNRPASPWDIRDAFVAAAILLKANGADSTRQGQWNAAMRYFSGGTNPAYSFYGDSVLELADKYRADIDKLN
jgi:peptidoglycan hydrolase CwlO-like protein